MVKKLFGFATVMVMTIIAGGCNLFNSSDAEIDYIPVKEEKDGKWGFLGPDGKFKYSDEFKNEPSCVVNGYFSVEESEGYTLYKVGEKPQAVKGCENLKAVGYMNEGLIPVVRDKSRITIVDGSGKDKFTLDPIKNKEIVYCSNGYEDGMLLIRTEDDKYGYVDTNGKVVIAPTYTSAYNFSEGLAVVAKDEKKMVIDKKGNVVINIKKDWDTASEFNHGALICKDDNDHILFMDKKGETVKCPSKVKNVGAFNDSYYVFSDGDNAGVMSRKDNEIVIRAKYTSIYLMDNNKFLCNDDKKHQILNAKGEIEKELDEYEATICINGFGIFGKEKNSYIVMDNQGEIKKGCEFFEIGFSMSASYIIESDYFSIEAFANTITEKFTSNGIGNVKIGMKPSQFLTNPKDYQYTSSVTMDSLGGKGYKFNFSAKVEFTGRIADSHYTVNYYSYDLDWSYTWSDVTVNGFNIEAVAETTLGADATKAVVTALGKKGFKVYADVYKNGTGLAMLTNKDVLICIESRKDSESLTIGMIKLPDASFLESLKKEMENAADKEGSSAGGFDKGNVAVEEANTAIAAEECYEDSVAVVEDYDDW